MLTPTKRQHTDNNSIPRTISFVFNNTQITTQCSLHHQAQLLKTKLENKMHSEWTGKVILNPTRSRDIILYNVLTQENIKTITLPYDPDSITLIGKELVVFSLAYYSTELYVVDTDLLSCKKVLSSSDFDACFRCGTQLRNNRIAIGTHSGILIVTDEWKIIEKIPCSRVSNVTQLKSGNIVLLHIMKLSVSVCDELFNKLFQFDVQSTIFLLATVDRIYGYGINTLDVKDLQTQKSHLTDQAYVCLTALECGLIVRFTENTLEVYDKDTMWYAVPLQKKLDDSKRPNVQEVKPGVLAWQAENELVQFDVIKKSFVSGYSKSLPVDRFIMCFL
jgi:hypothetical protein